MTITAEQFARDLLELTRLPVTDVNVAVVVAWQIAEGSVAAFNPLDTTEPAPGAVDLPGNSAGVKEYPSYEVGLGATAVTLALDFYGPLRTALSTTTNPAQVAASAIDASPWGTKGVAGIVGHLTTADYNRPVPGSAGETDPAPAQPPAQPIEPAQPPAPPVGPTQEEDMGLTKIPCNVEIMDGHGDLTVGQIGGGLGDVSQIVAVTVELANIGAAGSNQPCPRWKGFSTDGQAIAFEPSADGVANRTYGIVVWAAT